MPPRGWRRRRISVAHARWRRRDTGVVAHPGGRTKRGRRTKRHGIGGEAWWWCRCCIGRLLRRCLGSRHLSLPRRCSRFLHRISRSNKARFIPKEQQPPAQQPDPPKGSDHLRSYLPDQHHTQLPPQTLQSQPSNPNTLYRGRARRRLVLLRHNSEPRD